MKAGRSLETEGRHRRLLGGRAEEARDLDMLDAATGVEIVNRMHRGMGEGTNASLRSLSLIWQG